MRIPLGSVLATAIALGLATVAGARDLDEIKRAGIINVGVFEGFAPFSEVKGDLFQGYDVDMAQTIGAALRVRVELVPVTGKTNIDALESGQVDVLMSVGENPRDAGRLSYVGPYAPFYTAIYGSRDLTLKAPGDLAGKRIGVARYTVDDDIATAFAPSTAVIQGYDDYATLLRAFRSRRVDTVAVSNVVGSAVLGGDAGVEEKFVLLSTPLRMGVAKDAPALAAELGKLVAAMQRDGRLSAISQTWLHMPLGPEDLRDSGS